MPGVSKPSGWSWAGKLAVGAATISSTSAYIAGAMTSSPPHVARPGAPSAGMDPWQTSIEGRVGKSEAALTEIKADIAVIKERISHLPTKDWIDDKFGKLITRTAAVAGIVTTLASVVVKFIPVGHF